MTRRMALIAAVAVLGFVGVARSAEDPNGTWKWTVTFGGQSRDGSVELRVEVEKQTGVYVGGQSNTETKIDDAKLDGDKVSFSVTRERDGNKFTTKYAGTIKGDTITGTSERERDG